MSNGGITPKGELPRIWGKKIDPYNLVKSFKEEFEWEMCIAEKMEHISDL